MYRDTVSAALTIPSRPPAGIFRLAAALAAFSERELAHMVTDLSVYRSATGEQFFRTSPTCGRTTAYRIEADSVAALERWLRENGFRPVVQAQACAA